ncbi:hypothetical protein ARAM_001776 [Aspergillus rambellii]|uniref:Uncharacterized protein n=1 Tax=Aspergillus rambellii TaxID=308745 RepID=A0A0F8WEK6_9EURO|nr:hypothetical protein ARAM_001776 [Aspergillus rambellii]
MKRCLSPAHLLLLDRRSFVRNPFATLPPRRPFGYSSRTRHLGRRPVQDRPSWNRRQFSVGIQHPVVDRQLLEDFIRLKPKKCPVPRSKEKNPEAWISLLDRYLPPSLRGSSEDTVTGPVHEPPSEMTRKSFMQTLDLANLLFSARLSADLDLLAHLGFKLNNWPAVYALLSRLLDAADTLKELSLPLQCGVIEDWSSSSGLSLDQLTDQRLSSSPQLTRQSSKIALVPGLTTLDAFTERPFAQDHSKSCMAEVWQSLGSIVLSAADASPNESKLAMSYVYRILARLHHSGIVSDRVYKYTSPDAHQANFRPPGMHLLSTHIMNVLSDTAWLVHEAEVAAKAVAAGEDPPFLPVKMGIKELGHEIWLEFILWCCVEHGHIKEGVWLIDQLKTRTGQLVWKFQSWKPLLQNPEALRDTKIDREASWHHRPESVDHAPLLRKRNSPPATFNGLGKRTLSVEVAIALLDNLPNLVYLGLGFRGVHAGALLRSINSLQFAIAPTSNDVLLPTTKATNWLTVRVIESGGLNPEADPQVFEDFLKATPCVVPPWSSGMCPVDEESLDRLCPSQLYDDTSALVGLIEYNLRFSSARRLCGDALNIFAMLQTVIDASKMQRINDFFSSRMDHPSASFPSSHIGSLDTLRPFDSSIPQVSNVTFAGLLDLITVSRAYAFGEWLLFSDDIDGPAIPPSAYKDQALAPSIIRFAAATKNNALCESVVESLSQPISSNTLRALLNFRIAMHQWDLVAPMLEYLRDYRSKSWGHSNVAALAAEIIRLDHTIQQQQSSDLASMATDATKANLEQATDILRRTLTGEFNELSHRTTPRFQERSLSAFQRLFLSLPASISPSLREITQSTSLPSVTKRITTPRNAALPYIPSPAFHLILSAVVDTQGSAAGKRLWDRWCLDIKSPTLRRLHEGGIPRFYLHHERNRAKGDPHFDPVYFKQVQKKAVIPNPNTVRIIAQAAVREYTESENARLQMTQTFSSTSAAAISPSSQGKRTNNPAEQILEFCIQKFDAFGLRRREINREVGGLVYKKQREGVKKWKKKKQQMECDAAVTA